MIGEDTLEIPASWAVHLDGRPRGRMTVERARAVIDDPYAGSSADWKQVAIDRVDAPYTLVAALGAEALPELVDMTPIAGWMDADVQRAAGEAMSVIPTDEAFERLLELATQGAETARADAAKNEKHFGAPLSAAIARFPERAVRLLAPRAVGRGALADRHRAILDGVIRRAPEIAERVMSSLAPEPAKLVEQRLAELRSKVVAAPEDLPAVLREPPWTRAKRRRPKPAAMELATLGAEPSMAWVEGERERWAVSSIRGAWLAEEVARRRLESDDDWRRAIAGLTRDEGWRTAYFLLGAPEQVARPLVRDFRPVTSWAVEDAMAALVARFELDALPLARWYASESPKLGYAWLVPYRAPELAPMMARAYARLASARKDAERWLSRHPEAAAIGLVPVVLGKDASAVKDAREALFALARADRATVDEAASRYGAEARAAVSAILDADPLDDHPARLPAMPAFFDAAALPAPELSGGKGALPSDAVAHLATMLAFSKPGSVYAGIAVVRDACERTSLSRFSWALFEAWLSSGASTKDKWALQQLAWLGDDETAYALVRLMKDWPRQGAAARAVLALDVLADMPSDVALVLVHQITQRAGPKSLKKAAAAKMAHIAELRGLSEEQLADRLVPTLGLDERGSMTLDYGPRRFTVGFDEQLAPFVLDAHGKRLKSLPKPGKNDDSELANASEKRFKDLKKHVRTIASTQIRRLEDAMVTRRRWIAEEHARWIVGHPLVVHIARRLVWAAYDEGRVTPFRVAEDGTLADVDDALIEVNGEIGVAHPIELEEVARWSELFADYEILQPFAQLGREVHRAAEGQTRADYAANVLKADLDATRVVGLEARGWQRGDVGDGGIMSAMERALGGGIVARIDLEPGLVVGLAVGSGPQRIEGVHLHRDGRPITLDELDDVRFSELMRDLATLPR